ncbi:MAG: LysR family transcriptional regulator [Clostridia bacterium]|nr:LysR family transcriptional regulator [Clostridia bacterium]
MELLQLKYFVDAADTQNFSETAKKFYVPPSAVSQSIKRLEKELGANLFTRQANKIKLNKNGMIFAESIRAALSLIDEAEKSITNADGIKKIRLSIYINRRIIMQTVEKFSRAYPDVDIVTKYLLSPDAEQVDLVISDIPLWKTDMPCEELLSEDILLAVHRDNPLSKEDTVTADALANEPFICTNKDSSLYSITQSICDDLGFSPRIVIRSDDPYYIRKCIELGLGISLIPSVSWRGQFSDQVILKKIGNYKRTTYVYKSSDRYIPEHIKKFLTLLHLECEHELSLTNK